jgi:hypothetical protein
VNDPGFVRGREPLGNLLRDLDHPLQSEAAVVHLRAERLSFDQLGDEVLGVAVRADVVDRQDVGMIEGAGRDRFLREATLPIGIEGGVVVEDFDRDEALQARVSRAIDLAHPARAQRAHDLIRPESREEFRHQSI